MQTILLRLCLSSPFARMCGHMLAAMLAAILALQPNTAFAQTYPTFWVSTVTGDDNNDGTTPQRAWKTIQRAYDMAQPGIYVWVLPGVYTESITSSVAGSDSRTWNDSNDGWIRIYGTNDGRGVVPNGSVIIRPPAGQPAFNFTHRWNAIHNYVIEGGSNAVRITNTTGPYWVGGNTMRNQTSDAIYVHTMDVSVAGTHEIDINNNLIENAGGSAIWAERCVRLNVNSNNRIINPAGYGIYYGNSIHPSQDYAVIQGNIIRNAALDAIRLDGNRISANILRNRIEGSQGWGVNAVNNWGSVYVNIINNNALGGVRNASVTNANRSLNVYHNTFHNNTGPAVLLDSATATITAVNNIYSNNTTALQSAAGTMTARASLFWQNTTDRIGIAAHASDRTGDPLYQSAAAMDFDLTSGSAAIDIGEVPPSWINFDFRQAMRPWGSGTDVGAYEIIPTRGTPPYFQDFEGTIGGEWARNQTVNVADFSRASGAFAQPTPGDQALAINTIVGRYYRVFYDVIYFDDWRGYRTGTGAFNHHFYIDRNQHRALTTRMGQPFDLMDPWKGAEVWGSNLGMGPANDQIAFQQWFDFTADDDFTVILFRSTGWTDGTASRSFAIDNVRVTDNIAPNNVYFGTPWTRRFRDLAMLRNFRVHSGDGPSVASSIFTGDLNNDAVLDVVIAGSDRQSPAGATAFLGDWQSRIYTQRRISLPARRGGALFDYDNDGDLDFYALIDSASRSFFANNGTGTFSSVGNLGFTGPVNQEGALAVDLNRDGWCDILQFDNLIRGNTVALNTINPQTATTYTHSFNLTENIIPNSASDTGDGTFAAATELNNDGWPDFWYPLNGGTFFISNGAGGYTNSNRGIIALTGGSAGSVFADFNNDSWPDLLVCSRDGPVTLWRNPGLTGNFVEVAVASGISMSATTSATFGDYDNDGDLDLYIVSLTGRNQFYRNRGAANGFTFELLDEGINVISGGGDASFADVQASDGILELVVTSESGYPTRLFEPVTSSNDRLTVRLIGRGEFGTTRGGNGARIDLLSSAGTFLQRRDLGMATGYGGQTPLQAHFGGINANIDYIVRVTSGKHRYQTVVRPSTATTVINGRTITRMLTINEADFVPFVDVSRWREVSADGQ
jgi:putative cofactor-binding repeat protein